MTLPGLVLELVLTGGLFLIALLLPFVSNELLEIKLSAELLGLALAASFLIGVLVDRFADSLLELWDSLNRCRWMRGKGLERERSRLLREQPASDPYPEGWLRYHLLTRGDPFQVQSSHLRVRIRVARSMIVLAPLLGASFAWGRLAPWFVAPGNSAVLSRDEERHLLELCLFGVLVMLVLAAVCWTLAAHVWKAPRTTDPASKEKPAFQRYLLGLQTGEELPAGGRALLPTPPVLWLAVNLAVLVGSLAVDADIGIAALLATAAVTCLAVLSWSRISGTYRQFLWSTAFHGARGGLREQLLYGGPDRDRQTSSDSS